MTLARGFLPRRLRSAAATRGRSASAETPPAGSFEAVLLRKWRQLKTRILLGIAAAAVSALTLMLLLTPRAPWLQSLGDLAQTSAAWIATVACLRAARRGGDTARAWAVMAVATGIWAAGVTAWTTYGLAFDHVYPFPSLADIGFVGYALPAAIALLLFPRYDELAVVRE